jgi:hypothetical protein
MQRVIPTINLANSAIDVIGSLLILEPSGMPEQEALDNEMTRHALQFFASSGFAWPPMSNRKDRLAAVLARGQHLCAATACCVVQRSFAEAGPLRL